MFKPLEYRYGEGLIGMDLFSGKAILDLKPKNTWRLSADWSGNGAPAFCVVGANGYGITENGTKCYQAMPSKNQTSILGLLFWPGTHRCSYFTGGDGNPDVEDGIITSFLEKTNFAKLPVTVTKLDHHGSSGEFDMGILKRLGPKSVIVTPGTMHAHPSKFRILNFLLSLLKVRA